MHVNDDCIILFFIEIIFSLEVNFFFLGNYSSCQQAGIIIIIKIVLGIFLQHKKTGLISITRTIMYGLVQDLS